MARSVPARDPENSREDGAMNVTCPNCATVYRVDPGKVPDAGVRARCSICSAVFAVQRDGTAQERPSTVAAAAAGPAPSPSPAPMTAAPPMAQAAGPAAATPPRAEPARPSAPPPQVTPQAT